jgi:hypothetical protein
MQQEVTAAGAAARPAAAARSSFVTAELTAHDTQLYSFRPADLRPADRQQGISAFMRIKNGADFLDATIRSHIAHFDEIVAVHNQCTDATPEILARLAQEFGPHRLRVFHYLPAVFPPGSEGHAREPANSPRSLVNYYNFALAMTRYRVVTKLDDDHLAIEQPLAAMVGSIRHGLPETDMLCFGGLNLARDENGRLGILAQDPFSGSGDIGFFTVTGDTYFEHDTRFERMRHAGLRRRFAGFVYWHLKYLKPDFGFANYGIERGDNRRYAAKRDRYIADRSVIALETLRQAAPTSLPLLQHVPLPEKLRLKLDRWAQLRDGQPTGSDFRAASQQIAPLLLHSPP